MLISAIDGSGPCGSPLAHCCWLGHPAHESDFPALVLSGPE